MAEVDAAAAAEEPEVDTRGEITLPLDGVDYHLRPSRKAISAIEKKLRPLPALVAEGSRGDLSLVDMSIIAAELMHAWAEANPSGERALGHREAKPERLADLIFEAGAPGIFTRLLLVLMGAMNGAYTAAGERKPTETTAD